MPEKWRWRFFGYESADEGQPVQVWYNSLPLVDKEEIADHLVYLQQKTSSKWDWPDFDPLVGAGGISEIRIPEIRSSKGAKYYRIYGYFAPSEGCYTFLHGTDKRVKNDVVGKSIAARRLAQIQRDEATAHEFDFEAWLDFEAEAGTGGQNTVC